VEDLLVIVLKDDRLTVKAENLSMPQIMAAEIQTPSHKDQNWAPTFGNANCKVIPNEATNLNIIVVVHQSVETQPPTMVYGRVHKMVISLNASFRFPEEPHEIVATGDLEKYWGPVERFFRGIGEQWKAFSEEYHERGNCRNLGTLPSNPYDLKKLSDMCLMASSSRLTFGTALGSGRTERNSANAMDYFFMKIDAKEEIFRFAIPPKAVRPRTGLKLSPYVSQGFVDAVPCSLSCSSLVCERVLELQYILFTHFLWHLGFEWWVYERVLPPCCRLLVDGCSLLLLLEAILLSMEPFK
jgi:hypothetical protein